MTTIYEQHDAAFAQVSAYVLLDTKSEQVGKVALKFPRNGAGRLYAYVHLIGLPMVRGFADGFGYDKRSAAVANAIGKIAAPDPVKWEGFGERAAELEYLRGKMRGAVPAMDSDDWTRALEKAGFTVLQAA